MKQYKIIVLSLLLSVLFAGGTATAQNGINSPFSQYGVGFSSMPYNIPAISALGGVAYTRAASNMINPFNPASYASVGMETLVFDMGFGIELSSLRDNSQSQFDADGNVGYIAIAFPLTKWWKSALGIMPLTDVNYQSTQTSAIDPGNEVKTVYEGIGGVSQFFWGNGFNILGGNDPSKAQLRMGLNLNLLFGNLTRAVTFDFTDNDSSYFIDSRSQKDTYVRNFTYDLGLQYEQPFGKDYRFSLGLDVKPRRNMTVRDNAMVYTFVTVSAVEYIRDTIFPLSGDDSEFESSLEQPFTTGVGVSLQRDGHWLLALDATFAPWSGLKYTENIDYAIFGQSPIRYDASRRFALGFQLLGDKNSANYMRRVTYSAGVHYEKGCLNLDLANASYKLNEWGAGVGMALPMRKGRSVLNLSVAYSSFGSTDILRRDALLFGISVGSCESWFVKRKFN